MPVVDSSKSSFNDLQKSGKVSPFAHGQLSKPASPIPGMTSLVPPSSFFGGVGIGAAITAFDGRYVDSKGASEIYKMGFSPHSMAPTSQSNSSSQWAY